MRDATQEIVLALTGQSLIWDAPEGRAASVTSVSVYRADEDDTATAQFTPTGTVETTPNTTSTAAAGYDQADPTLIPLTAVTSVAKGRTYLFGSATTGSSEWVTVASVSSLNVTARQPLVNAYATTAPFVSTRITAPVDATWVATVGNLTPEDSTFPSYRVVWIYVVNSVTYRHESYVDLVRHPAQHTVLPTDVDQVSPGWLDRLPVDYRRDQGQPMIDQAFSALKMDLLADGKLSRWVRHLSVVNELVAYRAVLIAEELNASNFGVGVNATLDQAQRRYQQRYDQLIREPKVPIQSSAGGAAVAGERLALWRR